MVKSLDSVSRKKWFSLIIISISVFVCILLLNDIKEEVNASYQSNPPDYLNPFSLLNHADTYFWFARNRSNSLPEFDSAAHFAAKARDLAVKQFAEKIIDSVAYRSICSQAESIIKLTKVQRRICRFNMNSRYPYYMEIMGYDDGLMEEDAARDDLEVVTLKGVLDKLLALQLPGRGQPISKMASPVIIRIDSRNPYAEELITQELNSRSSLNTISRHNLASILGKDTVSIDSIVADPDAMKKITDSFNSQELMIIEFSEADRVNGLYYYTLDLGFWNHSSALSKGTVQLYHLVRDRIFNQFTVIVLWLILIFFFISLVVNQVVILVTPKQSAGIDVIAWYYLPICFLVALVVYFLSVTFLFKNFINPLPGDYYASDLGEQWSLLYPLSFLVLPPFVNYILLGKLDNLIRSFRSNLDQQPALFAWLSGSLLLFPFTWTYYELIRFGFSDSVYLFLPVTLLIIFLSFFISRYWSAISNFPERTHIALRMSHLLALVLYSFLTWNLFIELLSSYRWKVISEWFFYFGLPGIILIEGIVFLITRRVKNERHSNVFNLTPAPDHIGDLELIESPSFLQISQKGKVCHSLYINARRETFAYNAFGAHVVKNRFSVRLIDFSVGKLKGNIHYPAFAKAFEAELPNAKFNDVAETARKTSNILGKLISGISSVGGLLIDEGTTKARDPKELARLLLRFTGKKHTVFFFDHLELAELEDLDLIEALISCSPGGDDYPLLKSDIPYFPVFVACGYGEYGLRDRLESILSKSGMGEHQGYCQFDLAYTRPTESFLAERAKDLPIQIRHKLIRAIESQGLDISPELSESIFRRLHNRGWIIPGTVFSRADLLAPIRNLEGKSEWVIPQKIKENERLRSILVAAAYLADYQGRFKLPVLEKVVKVPTMELVVLLREAELESVVYDLDEPLYFDWYSFTDPRLAIQFRESDNANQEELSQFAKECFRDYIHFFIQDAPINNISYSLSGMLKSQQISIAELMLMAERAARIYAYDPLLAFRILSFAATYLTSNGLAKFEDAKRFLTKALEIDSEFLQLRDGVSESERFEMNCLDFKLRLETGNVKDASTAHLWERLIIAVETGQLTDSVKADLSLLIAKYGFLLFSDQARQKAEMLCNKVIQSDAEVIKKVRARFYQIKLIPSASFTIFNEKWLELVTDTFYKYQNLLAEIKALGADNIAIKDLTREVLNDFAGSFMVDKLLDSILNPESLSDVNRLKVTEFLRKINIADGSEFFNLVRNYLELRVSMEHPDGKPFAGTEILDPLNLRTFLHNGDPYVDKRGICYTLNYWTRALFTARKYIDALEVGKAAYYLNLDTGDKLGYCIAAGTLGKIMKEFNEHETAYRWFEYSLGYGWLINSGSRLDMILEMLAQSLKLDDKSLGEKIDFYIRQYEVSQVLPWFPARVLDDELALDLLSNSTALEKMMRDTNPGGKILQPSLEMHPYEFLRRFRKWCSDYLNLDELTTGKTISSSPGQIDDLLSEVNASVFFFTGNNESFFLKLKIRFNPSDQVWDIGLRFSLIKGYWIIQSWGPEKNAS